MKLIYSAIALLIAAPAFAGDYVDSNGCTHIDMGGYYNLSLACHGSHQGAGRAAAISNPGDGDDDGGSDDDGSDDGDHDCGDGDGHDGGYDDDKDNNGHGNGDEGDCKGRGCHDDDNPGKGPKH